MNAIHYNALPTQHQFLRSRAQFAGLFGGIGSGKSHVGCFWAMLKALRNPGSLGLIGANSYRQLHDATLRAFEHTLREHGVPYTLHRSLDMSYRLVNGAVVLCRSMESYDMLRGVELGWFYLDELRDTRFEAWQVIKGRLRARNVDAREGRVTSSPNGFNWIYDEFIRKPADPATAAAYANHEAIFARTADNRYLPPDYVDALLASYDPLLAAQELDGRFINTAAGRIYHAFDRRTHVSEEADFLPGAPVLWALDFNVTPMTAVIAQWDEAEGVANGQDGRDGQLGGVAFVGHPPAPQLPATGARHVYPVHAVHSGLRVVDELWLTNASTQAMCEAFGRWLERATSDEPRAASQDDASPPTLRLEARGSKLAAIRVYGDAAGGSRSTAGPSDYAIIRQCFPQAQLCVPPANPTRRDRYNAVNAAFCDAAGRVRLRVHPRCRHLIEDLERAVYQPGSSMADTSDPLRGHISDALGYLVARVMPAGAPHFLMGRW